MGGSKAEGGRGEELPPKGGLTRLEGSANMFRGMLKQFFRLGMAPVGCGWVYPRAVRLKIFDEKTVQLRCEKYVVLR